MTTRGPSTSELDAGLGDLTKEVSSLRTDFAGFRASVETQLTFIKWVGTVFTAVLIAVIAGAGSVVWNASALNAEVKQQGVRLDKLEAKVDRLEQKVDQGFGQINQQLATVIQRLDQVVPKKGGL